MALISGAKLNSETQHMSKAAPDRKFLHKEGALSTEVLKWNKKFWKQNIKYSLKALFRGILELNIHS